MALRRPRTILLTLAAFVASAAALVSCRSLSKDEVAERLLALPKNARLREAGLERRTMTIVLDGREVDAEVAFVRAGRATDPGARPVVLVHGTPGSLFTWNDVVFGRDGRPGLADAHDVWLLDVVGHGVTRTEAPDPFTFQHGADWLAGAIRGLGIGPVHLVGNSYGGEFCWRAAADHPDLVRTLTLMDSSGWTRPADGWLPEEVKMREMSLAPYGYLLASRDNVRGALQPHFPFPVTDDQVEECFAVCLNAENWRVMVDLARDENGTRSGDLARIAAPTLLLWGADDVAFPVERDAKRFASAIPGATLDVLPGVGHYPHETVPGDVAAKLSAFFGQHR
jgi:pimeloyl-ACP methyl ester carboxylesterase